MTFSLDSIRHLIPSESTNVTGLFEKASTQNKVIYGIAARRGYALLAAVCSAVSVVGYGTRIATRLVTAVVYVEFKHLSQETLKDACNVRQSLLFALTLTAYVGLSFLFPNFYLFAAGHSSAVSSPLPLSGRTSPNPCNEQFDPLPPSTVTSTIHSLDQLPRHIPNSNYQSAWLNLTKPTNKSSRWACIPLTSELNVWIDVKGQPSLSVSSLEQWLSIIPQDRMVVLLDKHTRLITHRHHPLAETELRIGRAPTVQAKKRPQKLDLLLKNPLLAIAPPDHFDPPARRASLPTAHLALEEKEEKDAAMPHLVGSRSPAPVAALKVSSSIEHLFQSTYQEAVVKHANAPLELSWRHHLDQIRSGYDGFDTDVKAIYALEESRLVAQCKRIITALTGTFDARTQYQHFVDQLRQDARTQYQHFVDQLRQAVILLSESHEPPQVCKKFIQQICTLRYTGVHLYSYLSHLIEGASGRLPSANIDLATFETELRERNRRHQPEHLPPGLNRDSSGRNIQKLHGFLNYDFDPLIGRNVPYVDGVLHFLGRDVTLLRHGVPIYHSEVPALEAIWRGACKLLPWSVSSPAQKAEEHPRLNFNPDYMAFVQSAAAQGKNILHIVLEDGDEHILGNERDRVRLRLGLENPPHFHPLAFRMDGAFFKGAHRYPVEIAQVQEDFRQQLLGQFEKTGYALPSKLSQEALFKETLLNPCLKQVQELYFARTTALQDAKEFQAYLLLCYAHLTLHLCQVLNISILEAHCKDDIDRGNVFKTILKLHFLYITGQIQHESLTRVLVNTLAPPLIVKKQGIVSDREHLLYPVITLLKKAFQNQPQPSPAVVGLRQEIGQELRHGSYSVAATPNQGLFSLGFSAQTPAEYQDFITHLSMENSWALPPCGKDIMAEIAQRFDLTGNIQHQIQRDLIGLKMYLGGNLLSPQCKNDKNLQAAFGQIAPFLQTHGLSEADMKKVLCSFHQGLSADLFERLHLIFSNKKLSYTLRQDTKPVKKQPAEGIFLEAKDGVASIRFNIFAKVSNLADIIGNNAKTVVRLHASLFIPNHKTGEAQFTFSIID